MTWPWWAADRAASLPPCTPACALHVVTYEAETFGGQLVNLYPSKPVNNFPAQKEVLSRDLALRLAEQAAGFGAELREWRAVEHVARDDKRFVISTADGDDEARTLVLALGLGRFAPRRLGLADEERFLGKGLADPGCRPSSRSKPERRWWWAAATPP